MNQTCLNNKISIIEDALKHNRCINAAVFSVLRTLNHLNPGDTYYQNYLWHYEKRKDTFVDYYHVLWAIAPVLENKNIMEIGCRTGISICQLLSAMNGKYPSKIILSDIFNDGFISPELVKMNARHLGLPTNAIEFIIGDSQEKIPEFKQYNQDVKFSYILVDGCHDKDVAKKDLENVVDMVESGGFIFFDDIAPDGCNLRDVWESFKLQYFNEFLFRENYDGKGIGIGIKR